MVSNVPGIRLCPAEAGDEHTACCRLSDPPRMSAKLRIFAVDFIDPCNRSISRLRCPTAPRLAILPQPHLDQ